MIGGMDIILWVRDDIIPSDAIVRIVRRHWPDFIFQDADDPELPIGRPADLFPRPVGDEFFLYRDLDAARSWRDNGAIPENQNTLLYVILGSRRRVELGLRSVTLVVGERAGEMSEILHEVETLFDDINSQYLPGRAA